MDTLRLSNGQVYLRLREPVPLRHPPHQAAILARFGRASMVDVADLVRWMAERSGLTEAETVLAVAQALRVHAQLQAREGEDR